ncbi:MAG: glutathione S-transferase family protein [Alphaproteobacteria bacterium]|nr:glutathione S-transferase family protein [Alphaproteobacteria bacterium]
MADSRLLTVFHSSQTRSTGVIILLEELDAPYTLHPVNIKAGDQRKAPFLAINPLGKVPAVKHGDALITEQVAIYIHLADLFPKAGLAPALDHPQRGPYLRWLAFYGSAFEPAMVDHALKREPGNQGMSPYGSVDAVIKTVTDQLRAGPYLLGDKISAADILWGTALTWMTMFKIFPATPEVTAYIKRISDRSSTKKVNAADETLGAQHKAVAGQ